MSISFHEKYLSLENKLWLGDIAVAHIPRLWASESAGRHSSWQFLDEARKDVICHKCFVGHYRSDNVDLKKNNLLYDFFIMPV